MKLTSAFLHRERDCKADQRKAEAMNALIEVLAKASVDELLREQEGESGDHRTDQGVAVRNRHRD